MSTVLEVLVYIFFNAEMCTATTFGFEGDRFQTEELYCKGVKSLDGEIGIAHRTLPCNTKVILYNPRTQRSVQARVVDRGPYGAIHNGKWKIKIRKSDPGTWRGCLDLTELASKKLKHNGFESILYLPLKRNR